MRPANSDRIAPTSNKVITSSKMNMRMRLLHAAQPGSNWNCVSSCFVEHHERARLDTLARHELARAGGIAKAGVRHEAPAHILARVIALQQQYFIRAHLRNVEPAMRRVVAH